MDVPAGKHLARPGDLAYEFFVIREGTAEVDVGGEIKNTLGATSPMKLVVMAGHELRALRRDMPQVIDKLRSACYERVSGGGS